MDGVGEEERDWEKAIALISPLTIPLLSNKSLFITSNTNGDHSL